MFRLEISTASGTSPAIDGSDASLADVSESGKSARNFATFAL